MIGLFNQAGSFIPCVAVIPIGIKLLNIRSIFSQQREAADEFPDLITVQKQFMLIAERAFYGLVRFRNRICFYSSSRHPFSRLILTSHQKNQENRRIKS